MRLPYARSARPRRGKILVTFALLLSVLLGVVGLVIDGGMLMAAHRQAQNAADAAAMAAAMELYRGNPEAVARTAGTTFGKDLNSPSATVTLNFGTSISTQAAALHRRTKYVEAIVEVPVATFFIHVLGVNPDQKVSARAVAGFENITSGEGAIVLDPRGSSSGLTVGGGAKLYVMGAIAVNSRGRGIDQYGVNVESTGNQYGVATGNNSQIYSTYLQVAGGVDVLQNIYHVEDYPNTPDLLNRKGPYPLYARAPQITDPLANLPIPVPPNLTVNPPISVGTGETRTFTPGIYNDIVINGSANVTFQPGVYVLMPNGNNRGLTINGSPTVTANGVTFYATGSNYLTGGAGHYDTLDGTVDPVYDSSGNGTMPALATGENPLPTFARVIINVTGGRVAMSPPTSGNFEGVLFFQRRRSQTAVSVQGNAGPDFALTGAMYAKWANFGLSGGGKYNAQFVVGSLTISGQATVTIDSGGKSFGKANQVFLVE